MDLSHPARSLFGPNRARVLHVLATLADPATGRRIFELSGNRSLSTTQGVLDDLVEIGIVKMRQLGASHAYTLNRDHVLWPAIRETLEAPATLEQRIADILREELESVSAGAVLFGSFARGDAGPDSDVDIVVVWEEDVDPDEAAAILDRAAERIRSLSGNRAQLITLTRRELADLAAEDDPLADSLRREARPLTTAFDIKQIIGS